MDTIIIYIFLFIAIIHIGFFAMLYNNNNTEEHSYIDDSTTEDEVQNLLTNEDSSLLANSNDTNIIQGNLIEKYIP